MYRILNNQKSRVIDGKYSKDNYIFLVEQAYKKQNIKSWLILSNFEYIQYLLDIIDKQNKIIQEQNEILYMNGIDVLDKEKGR